LRGLSEYGLRDLIDHLADDADMAGGTVESLQLTIAREEAAYNAAESNSAAQRTALQRLLVARRALIARHADDPNAAIWMADLATDLYFRTLGQDALEV